VQVLPHVHGVVDCPGSNPTLIGRNSGFTKKWFRSIKHFSCITVLSKKVYLIFFLIPILPFSVHVSGIRIWNAFTGIVSRDHVLEKKIPIYRSEVLSVTGGYLKHFPFSQRFYVLILYSKLYIYKGAAPPLKLSNLSEFQTFYIPAVFQEAS
jgi:hypothetical protein